MSWSNIAREELVRIEAIRDEIARLLSDATSLASTYRDNAQLRALLETIVKETKPGDDGALLVAIGGGWRRLPDDMTQAIKAAEAFLRGR